ncbi:YIP1 family protein [Chryseobacterium sp. ERMR1:04]|uniref:YIP1 family protein n=1 Tax=Chryseobacterium sp. ERMR1:04 TaxID=1705393 RepID=UPI0006C8512C|nr:YIP1 family protein [Chryseobacterium sp. ERMR1:04]KPH13546.1 hypothetical protein AMQ68_08205 [Chryseobacterium sp. ERMR1:04]
MNWKTVFNPFERFNDKTLLIAGILSIPMVIAIGYFSGSYFSSIYRINNLEKISVQGVAIPTLISFLSSIIILFILGKILNSKTRFIDIVNTVLISQIPLAFLLLFQKLTFINTAAKTVRIYQKNPTGSFPIVDFIIMISTIIFVCTILIYSMAIYYNGFKTATNIKKWQSVVLFCVVSFLTMVICQIFNN